jgi:hypothetical protein
LVSISSPEKLWGFTGTVLKEHDAARDVLDKEIIISITIDIHELGTRHIEPTKERLLVLLARFT